MLKIKLARFGKKNQPHYRMIVAEARSKRDSGYIANLGHYAPTQTPKLLQVDMDAYKSWLAKGAQPTDTVTHLIKRLESGNPFPEKTPRLSRKAKAKQEEANPKGIPSGEAVAEEVAPVAEESTTPEAPVEAVTTEETPAESEAAAS